MSCLRRIAGVTSRDRIRNKEVYDRVGLLQDVAHRIQQRRMQYFGHVQRMDHTSYPKLALHGYVHGTRRQGRPTKRWIDMVKDDCKQRDIDIHQATEMTQHRPARRSLVKLLHLRRHGNKSSHHQISWMTFCLIVFKCLITPLQQLRIRSIILWPEKVTIYPSAWCSAYRRMHFIGR